MHDNAKLNTEVFVFSAFKFVNPLSSAVIIKRNGGRHVIDILLLVLGWQIQPMSSSTSCMMQLELSSGNSAKHSFAFGILFVRLNGQV